MHVRLSVTGEGVTPPGTTADVVVDAPVGSTVADVRPALSAAVDVPADVAWWSGRRLLPDTAVLGGPGLRDGDVVALGRPGEPLPDAGCVLHLAVTGGPAAGRTVPLGRGVHVVGRGDTCDLRLSDDDVSRTHAAVTVTSSGVSLRDLGSTNGTRLDGVEVDLDGVDLGPDEPFRLGDSTVVLRAGGDPPPALRATGDGRVVVVRAPRLGAEPDRPVLVAPEPPRDRSRPRISWIGALLPAVAGVGLAYVLHTWQFLAFAALTPLTVLGTAAGDRWSWRASRRRAAARHTAAVTAFAAARTGGVLEEQQARRRAHPDPAAVLRTACAPGARLWERRLDHDDALCVRIGTADRPTLRQVRVVGGDPEPAGTARDVPVVADLTLGPLGLAGPRDRLDAVVRAVVGGLVTAHSPADLDLVLLLSDGVDADWDWLRWLPHRVQRAADPAARSRVLAGLDRRCRDARATHPSAASGDRPWTVLVVDRVGVLADHPVLAEVLAHGVAAHVSALCLDETPAGLPHSCAAMAVVDGTGGTRLELAGTSWWPQRAAADAAGAVVGDGVSAGWAERLARGLAAFDDPAGAAGGTLPDAVALVDLLGHEPAGGIADRWRRRSRTTEPLRVPIGLGSNGPVELDLTADGPHALIAGTTGSGKSELLQTLVAGLAVRFAPDDLALLLVDYKGGAAFGSCAQLPHTLGLVTDLDAHLTRRVLRSLDAELRRREHLLAVAGVADLAAHRRQCDTATPPRLVIVVDEFATLAADLPDFVPGLVDVAQRGRSLGVHLVLATQRPGTAVSPAIRANATLRIALRVSDPGESTDVIGVAAAAALDPDRPGRAVVRDGRGLVELQTARVTVPVRDLAAPVRVTPVGPWQVPPPPATADVRTDLDVLVDVVTAAWAHRRAEGAEPPLRTWVPALPPVVTAPEGDGAGAQRLVVGLADLPAEQRTREESLDLAVGGTVLVAGAGRTGRTGLVRTTVARAVAAGALAVVVDGPGTTAALAGLPGVVAHVRTQDGDALARLLDQLETEVSARQSAPPPWTPVVLAVDGWDACVSALDDLDAGRSTDRLLGVLRAAGSVGITALVTGDRALLGPRVAATADRMFLLRLTDPADYAMAGLGPRDVPGAMPPGRAVVVPGGHEVQLAVLGTDPAPAAQWDQVARVSSSPGHRAATTLTGLGLRGLPDRVVAGSLTPGAGRVLALGVGGDDAATVTVDPWAAGGRWLVAGPPRSGRSTALVRLAEAAVQAGSTVGWSARPHSPLSSWAATRSLPALDPQATTLPRPITGSLLLLLDDADDLQDQPVGDAVVAALRSAATGTLAVVCSGRPDELAMSYRGVVAEVRRARRGLLLRPGPGDGELVGIRTGRARAGSPPGRGVLVADGVSVDGRAVAPAALLVQVAADDVQRGRVAA